MTGTSNQLTNVEPEELKFQFELEKQSYCDLKVSNNTDNHVAYKVKTTSPKKYFVRPNTGVIKPRDSCVIRVTLQAQRQYPPDMQCKDKFLVQSTIVPENSPVDDLPQDTFNKDNGKTVEECKLRVVYIANSTPGASESLGTNSMYRTTSFDDNEVLMRLKDERDAAVRQAQQVQKDLEMMKRRRNQKSGSGFSFRSALIVALIGIVLGFLVKFYLSSPSPSSLPSPSPSSV